MAITLVILIVVLVAAAGAIGLVLERRRGDRDLLTRQKHARLDVSPLDSERARDYRADWDIAQARFADDPYGAITDADMLIEALMCERGYPVGDVDTTVANLSVEQADVLEHYRAAHSVATALDDGDAPAESLRRAMVHYRALFAALLDDDGARRVRPSAGSNRRTV